LSSRAALQGVQVLIASLYLGRLPAAALVIPVAAAAQSVLLLLRLQFYTRLFPATRFAFVDDLREVLHDVSAVVPCCDHAVAACRRGSCLVLPPTPCCRLCCLCWSTVLVPAVL
jgi:hypothetical protein